MKFKTALVSFYDHIIESRRWQIATLILLISIGLIHTHIQDVISLENEMTNYELKLNEKLQEKTLAVSVYMSAANALLSRNYAMQDYFRISVLGDLDQKRNMLSAAKIMDNLSSSIEQINKANSSIKGTFLSDIELKVYKEIFSRTLQNYANDLLLIKELYLSYPLHDDLQLQVLSDSIFEAIENKTHLDQEFNTTLKNYMNRILIIEKNIDKEIEPLVSKINSRMMYDVIFILSIVFIFGYVVFAIKGLYGHLTNRL